MEVEEELRKEIGMEKHMMMKVVENRQQWAGHMQKTNEDRLTQRTRIVEREEEDRNKANKDEVTVLREVLKGQR